MKSDENNIDKKSSRRRYIIPAAVCLALFIVVSTYLLLSQEPKPDPASEKVIRESAGFVLNKDSDKLTDQDFAQITNISIGSSPYIKLGGGGIRSIELSDISLLRKFTNLQSLDLGHIMYPKNKIPKWMTLMSELGIYDSYERFSIDLSPLEKLYCLREIYVSGPITSLKPLANLTNLQRLEISSSLVKDIKPFANLTNLQSLQISCSRLSDIKPLGKLANLKSLTIRNMNVSNITPLANLTKLTALNIFKSPVVDLKPIEGLVNMHILNLDEAQAKDIKPLGNFVNLRRLSIIRTPVSDLEPLKELRMLQRLDIRELPITDLEPLENLNELKELIILNCNNITNKQIDDLQKALPNLKIESGNKRIYE